MRFISSSYGFVYSPNGDPGNKIHAWLMNGLMGLEWDLAINNGGTIGIQSEYATELMGYTGITIEYRRIYRCDQTWQFSL